MSFREAQARLEQGSVCKLSVTYQSFDKDDREVFDGWVKDRKPVNFIVRVVASDGVQISEKTIRHHLIGQCMCPDDAVWKGAYRATS